MNAVNVFVRDVGLPHDQRDPATGQTPLEVAWAPEIISFLEAWARGEHPAQRERVVLEAAMLAADQQVPVEVARLCGDFVHARPWRRG